MLNDTNIVISVTCYNNEDEVIAFAKQIAKQSVCKNIQLIITCNSTKKYDYLKAAVDEVSIVSYIYNPGKNLGYLQGCLYGVKKTNLPNHYWLMISNTDLTFTTNTYFEDILNDVNSDDWCIGSNILLKETEKSQNPFFLERPSKRSMLIRKIAYSNFLLYQMYFKLSNIKAKIVKNEDKYSSQYVYAVHGSCFLLNSEIVPVLMKESHLLDECLAQYRKGRIGSVSTHSVRTMIGWHYKLYREAENEGRASSCINTVRNLIFGFYKKIRYVRRES